MNVSFIKISQMTREGGAKFSYLCLESLFISSLVFKSRLQPHLLRFGGRFFSLDLHMCLELFSFSLNLG